MDGDEDECQWQEGFRNSRSADSSPISAGLLDSALLGSISRGSRRNFEGLAEAAVLITAFIELRLGRAESTDSW